MEGSTHTDNPFDYSSSRKGATLRNFIQSIKFEVFSLCIILSSCALLAVQDPTQVI